MLSPAPQYRCKNLARARRVAADATFSGVAFTEVLTDDALAPRPGHPTDSDLRQVVLLFHLAQAVDTSGPDLLVQGGVQITNLPDVWADAADRLISTNASAVPSPAERSQVQDQLFPLLTTRTNLDRILVVRFERPTFNGIDFVEVLDAQLDAQSDLLRQRVLLLHLFLPVPAVPAGLTGTLPQDLLIQGGVRVTNIAIPWAVSADALVNGDVSTVVPPQDLTELQTHVVPLLPTDKDSLTHILIIRTDVSGDFSPYELSIFDDSSSDQGFSDPFFGFDSQLSRVTFSFKVDCPSDFDCLVEEPCPTLTPPAPAIDYLAKDYVSFRGLMLDRMAQTIPDWTERSPADIGVTVVELLAFAADQLSYYQDSVANEAYLGTARRRPSLRRHARLLDYTPREGTNARTFVHVEVAPGSNADGAELPIHTPLLSRTDALTTTIVSPPAIDVALQAGSQVFETMESITLHGSHDAISIYTWGDEDCCLPKGAVRATLLNQDLILDPSDSGAIKVGALLAFVEVQSPNEGAPPDPQHRHVVRLTRVRTTSDPLEDKQLVEVEWAADDALPFPLCVRDLSAGNPVSVAQGNIVLADHGHSVTQDLTPPSAVRGNQRFLPRLLEGPITFQAQVLDAGQNLILFDPTAPATAALQGDPRLARPDVVLFPTRTKGPGNDPKCDRDLSADTDHWTPVSDLLESGPFSQSFVVEMENDGTAQLRFGDDILGQTPTETLFACYRVGNGAAGNIGSDGLSHIVVDLPGIVSVSNVIAATGGEDPEPLQEIQLNAPQAFRVQERAVTPADYTDVAKRHPGVQRAVATLRFTGSWYTMFVAVDRLGGAPVDDAFKVDFGNFLERFRLAGYDLEIQGAISVPLDIKLTVCVLPGFLRSNVKKALLDALSNRDLPNGQRGFFHPDNFSFGQPVFLSQLVAVALKVPGVGAIDTGGENLVFKRLRRLPDAASAQGVLKMERLEIAQLDNDPSQPEHGKLALVMQGGGA